jgi:polyhydroxyalkanoate synthesis regulator phasin
MARRSGGSKSTRSGASRTRSTAKRSTAKRSTAKRTSTRRSAAGRSDKSVQAFRDALERSVTLSRDRIQEVVDDAVKRGRMTRGDANELVSNLVSRGRRQTDQLLRDLEKLLDQARRDFDARTAGTRSRATRAAGRAARGVRDAADRPLAEADRIRRRAGVPGSPITAYEQLTAGQVKSRLADLTKADLRKVRTQEKRGKARKGVLDDIERRLAR